MAIKDISEDFVYDLSLTEGVTTNYQLKDVAFDIAVNNMPFFIAATDEQPYRRESAPSKREQIDQTTEPGEQSFTGWWFRSQSSFHLGAGARFFEPVQDETLRYRFWDSEGVDVWTKGEVTLLKNVSQTHNITGTIAANGRPKQQARTIVWNDIDGVLVWDEYDVDKMFQPRTGAITNKALTSNVATLTSAAHPFTVGMEVVVTGVDATFNGTYRITAVTTNTFSYAKTATDVTSTAATGSATSDVIHFIDYNSGTDDPVYAICDDGTTAYWVTNTVQGGANKLHVYKKALTADSTTAGTLMFSATGIVVANATMEFIKERIVMCVNNAVYEFGGSATALPTAIYTHPSTDYQFTSVAASGPAIYVSGFRSHQSGIIKFTLSSAGVMPTLTSAVTAAEFPPGEIVFKIYYYLGYMCIGTNKGIRVATVSPDDGSINYGPITVELINRQPCFDFCARDRFVWCATGVNNSPGLTRIDLSEQISPLRFAYANDISYKGVTDHDTTTCAFLGLSDQIFFTSAAGSVGYAYCEDVTTLVQSGYLRTGFIRYATIESKYFKFLKVRGDLDSGTIDVNTITNKEVDTFLYNVTPELTNLDLGIARPVGAQEYLAFKFTLNRDLVDTNAGAEMSGYQVKALPAIEKQRLIQFPLYCYDVEMDKYNNLVGSEDDRAFDRISELEDIEKTGNIVTVQDFRTNETYSALIEEIRFFSATPPSERFNGFGGKLLLTVRKL